MMPPVQTDGFVRVGAVLPAPLIDRLATLSGRLLAAAGAAP